jgi:hypothetical protein
MSNAGMQELFNTYGNRICSISLNNNKVLLLNYKGSARIEDITFETIGGCDMMAVKRISSSHGKELKFTDYIVTEFIENVVIMDEDFEDYRVDPLILK